MKSKPDFLAIVGPTASGKTELGLRLARETGGEIISADSRQVYRFLSVGTAKPLGTWIPRPALYEVEGIPYHLVDIQDPAQPFTAADFVRLARETIAAVRSRGRQPILVGGTGLYLKALTGGLAPLPPRHEALRAELRALADQKGRAYLHAQLAKADPEAAARIPANNIHRVMRAMEVFQLTGKPISAWHREHQNQIKTPSPQPSPEKGEGVQMIGIDLPREELHRRIEKRCAWMLDHGLIEETEQLLQKGYAPDCPALTGLGYPRVVTFLKGELSREELGKLLAQDTRQYAKRQMTWFRNQMKVTWNAS